MSKNSELLNNNLIRVETDTAYWQGYNSKLLEETIQLAKEVIAENKKSEIYIGELERRINSSSNRYFWGWFGFLLGASILIGTICFFVNSYDSMLKKARYEFANSMLTNEEKMKAAGFTKTEIFGHTVLYYQEH